LTSLTGTASFSNGTRKWTNLPEGIVNIEDVVLYPSLASILGQDQPLPSIEEELVPQGRAKNAAARNANLQPFNVADELNNYGIDDNNSIIAAGDIPQQPPHAPLVVNNTDHDHDAAGSGDDDDNDEDVDEDEDDDNLSDGVNDDDNKPADAINALEGNKSDGNQGAQKLRRKGKGTTKKYTN
jgi:hypothetical protein